MWNQLAQIRALLRDRAANVAIVTAFSALPVLGLAGLAIDYAVAVSAKARLDSAADAAAIAAITKTKSVIQANNGVTGTALQDGHDQGVAAFMANAGRTPFLKNNNPVVPTVVVSPPDKQTLTVKVTYSAAILNSFGPLFNVPQTLITGSTSASLLMPAYKTIYMALDTSESMGIGASQADMDNLYNLTTTNYGAGNGCVFGCHVADQYWDVLGKLQNQPVSNESLAKSSTNPPIKLRFDVLKAAVATAIDDAMNSAYAQFYTMGLYTIGASDKPATAPGLNTIIAPTNALNQVQAAANNLHLGSNTTQKGTAETDFNTAFVVGTPGASPFNLIVPASGSGGSAADPITYALIITDGMGDAAASCSGSAYPANSPFCTSAFNSTFCDAMKAKGVTVIVLNTVYMPIYLNDNPSLGFEGRYQFLVANPKITEDKISSGLKGCTTPSTTTAQYYYEASDTAGIQSAVRKIFEQITEAARITN